MKLLKKAILFDKKFFGAYTYTSNSVNFYYYLYVGKTSGEQM